MRASESTSNMAGACAAVNGSSTSPGARSTCIGCSMHGCTTEVPVLRTAHELVELIARHPQEPLVIADFQVDGVIRFELVVDDRLDAPGHAHRRHGAALAAVEHLRDAAFVRQVQLLAAEQVAHLAEH